MFVAQLLLLFERYKFACDQQVVSFECVSIGEVQRITAVLTTSKMEEESQSITFNHGHGEQVSSGQGVVLMNGRVVAVLRNYSVINNTEHTFQYHSDIMLKFSSTSIVNAAISCSPGIDYHASSKELSLSSELLLLFAMYFDHF